ncbi:MAG TPA: hypothetical protein PLC89_01465 [Haliscomenobacter sp.]|uniref:hypothetical protein n=1 Tax=Haliscomenobacter sp. TaxID=2717303 RepID=UPI002BD8E928|nr:hypothetical protein [Haliscomenobacter sp.]HOY15924.1 hypothetical protein [Haliscomenobacter sp.]
MIPKLLFFVLGLCFLPGLWAQGTLTEPKGVLLTRFTYGLQLPAGTLKERFGTNFIAGGGLDWQWGKKNWVLGIDGQYLFGNRVKEDPLAGLRTVEGYIIGNDREVADIPLRERGWYFGLTAGKVFPVNDKQSPRAGFRVNFGLGYLQHKIRIQDDPLRSVPQLATVYKKGYDRLSNGLALQQFFGYQALSKDRRSNFIGGLEFFQGFTRGRRSFDFATQSATAKGRVDVLMGIRVGWILPFYADKAEDIYY